ncbi:MAG: glycerol acyltransferase [Anaerolineales bacterium]|nr:glycerol acyltransferase [Anaerolineales bacterium]
MTSNFEALTQINLDDLVESFGWQNYPLPARLLRLFFRNPAQTFARHMVEYDEVVGSHGLAEGGWNLLRRYVKELRIIGADRVPDSAFLALSNHPGMTDTVALFAALKRKDLHIIALDRPFLNTLPNTTKRLFYVYDDPAKRMTLVRQVSSQLKNGGTALTFPAGHIEPDPDVYPGAIEALNEWTDSVGVFVRMAPNAAILPVLVRSVVAAKYANHWILKIKKTREEKEKLAAALQLLGMILFNEKPVTVTVQIGRPIYIKDLGTNDTNVIHRAVLAEMKTLIENPPDKT